MQYVFFLRFLIALAPVLALLGTILWLRWRAPRAAALAWLVAVLGAAVFFGAGPTLLAAASAKGLSLALLVMSIVWAAVFLYSLARELGAVQVIANRLLSSTSDPLFLALLLAWTFAGFMQGIAGFGVPVAVVAPLMVLAGFSPVQSIAAAMIGHSWAITFGSMGSSFFAIQLVMGLDDARFGPLLALLFLLPILVTGLSVAHLAAGWAGMRRAVPLVLLTAVAMSALMWGLNVLGAAPVSSMLPGLLGAFILWLAGRRSSRHTPVLASASAAPVPEELSFRWAFLPYALLTVVSIIAQFPALKSATADLRFALNYPAQTTALGFGVNAQEEYAAIRLVGHPAPLLLLSASITYLVYRQRRLWQAGVVQRAWSATVRQTTGTTVGVALMVMMALVIADSGMAALLAEAAQVLGRYVYLVVSPFIGLLGAFVTGSNTNSNIMFGPLQRYASDALLLSTVLVAAAQTLGGSIGSGVAPDKALIGVSVVDSEASEGEVMRRALPYGLLCVLIIGFEIFVVSMVTQ
jgi:lactate permease